MKMILYVIAVLWTSVLQGCQEDAPEISCTEGVLLGPVCPFGAGYLGYSVFIKENATNAISYSDSVLGDGFIIAVLGLPQSYQNQSRTNIYFKARVANPDEIESSLPRTANCVQPPLFVIEEIKSECAPSSTD